LSLGEIVILIFFVGTALTDFIITVFLQLLLLFCHLDLLEQVL